MYPPKFSYSRFFATLFVFLFPWMALGQAAPEYLIRDEGRTSAFELASDELLVSRPGSAQGEVIADVRAKVQGAKILADFGTKALVKLPKPIDPAIARARGAVATTAAMPGSEAQPVVYKKGAAHDATSRRYVSSTVLVRLRPGESAAQLVARTGAVGTRKTELEGHAILRFSNAWRALDAANRLKQTGAEATVMLERVLERFSVPNDPFFANQWHLRNIGQGGGTLGIDADVVNAWDISRGNGVTIVLVDDSLQTTHPDLAPNTPAFDSGLHHDFRDNDSDPRPSDFGDWHGTAVGGVAAARQNNNIGTSGSAPEARLLGVRIIGGPVSDQDIADALRWEPGGEVASVSNNSWGYTGAPALHGIDIVIKDALQRAATEGRNGLGQITLFANGNSLQSEDNGNYSGLANSRYVAAIGAITNFGDQAYYSTPGANLLVSAPSNGGSLGIFTTDVTGNDGYNPYYPNEPADRNYTNSFGGTSSATPLTSGGAALIIAANPTLGWRDVHEILAQTARKIDVLDPDWADNSAGFHFNHKYGAGMIDLTAAVVRATDWEVLSAETSVTRSLAAPLVPAPIPDKDVLNRQFDFADAQNLRVERVELVARITHGHRSDLDIVLISPSGKRALLAQHHRRPSGGSFDNDIDYDDADGQGWTFTTTHFWGENSQGLWALQISDVVAGTTGTLELARLNIYGTPSAPQRLRFAVQRQSILENAGPALLRVERVGGTTGVVSVDLASMTAAPGRAAVPGQDYVAVAQTLTFEDGESFKEVPVTILDNALEDGNRYVYFSLKHASGASLGGITLTRLDIIDDESNVITVVPGDRDISEKDGLPNPGTFVISRSKATSEPLIVSYTLSGTAQEGVDYTVSGSTTIGANAASTVITVTPIDDDLLEGTETVLLTINDDPTYGVGTPGSAQLNLIDNDVPLVDISAIDNSATEEGLTTGAFRITRKHPRTSQPLFSDTALTVNLEIGGSAQPGQNYVPIEDRAVIAANSDHVDIIVTPIDDTEYHANQVVVLKLAPSDEYAFGFTTEASVNILDNEPIPDASRPTVQITVPANGAVIPAPATTLPVGGTASDNQLVDRVTYQVNDGAVRLATGTTQWSADIIGDVVPGMNTLKVRSFDQYDNASDVATRTFTYLLPRQLNIALDPGGKITSGFLGITGRNAGFIYTITAKPTSKNFVFAGWTGDLQETSREFTFVMPDKDASVTANFVPNPFSRSITGNYEGLVRAVPFAFDSSGFIEITLTPSGSFSGSLLLGGVKYPLKGAFTADQPAPGHARFREIVARKDTLFPLQLDLTLDLAEAGTRQITGSISNGSFAASVLADRAVFNKKTDPYSPAGGSPQIYTLIFPAIESPSSLQPRGLGWGRVSIDSGGVVKWAGVLPDGTKASQSTILAKDLTWPLFLNLYKNNGVMLGLVVLDNNATDSDLNAQLDWFKAPIESDKLFPTGFNAPGIDLLGSLYTAPARGQSALPELGSTGTISFREGYLRAGGVNGEFDADITISTTNQVTIVDRNGTTAERVEMRITPGTGLFRGSFIHPLTSKLTPFSGAIFQRKQPGAAGQFIGEVVTGGAFQTGQVLIAPPGASPP